MGLIRSLVMPIQGAFNFLMLKRYFLGLVLALPIALSQTQPAAAQIAPNASEAYKRGDYAAALKLLWPQAAQGNAEAQNNLGLMYYRGQGIPQDRAEAASWFRMAAEKGHARAQYNLGLTYHKGAGVPQDSVEALKWFRKAAEQGNARAQNNLAVMYHRGDGVPEDSAEAVKWFRKAAAQGHARAQNNLRLVRKPGEEATPESPPVSPPVSPPESPPESPLEPPPETSQQSQSQPQPQLQSQRQSKPELARRALRAQLGAFKSKERAAAEALRLNGAHETILGGRKIVLDRADLGARGVFYRLRAGPFNDQASAQLFCQKFTARKRGCIVVRP
jgi:uncharacterized protein